MENKYYTPEVGEFCVGFEFELNEPIRDASGTKIWSKYKLGNQPSFIKTIFNKYFFEESIKNYIRVKYLDKNDIESLGFLHDNDLPNNYVRGDIDLLHNPETNFIKIDDADGFIVYFQGKIKNKSELKKLLSQIY